MNYYAIFKGNKTGVFNTWDECKSNIEGYIDPVYKKFDNRLDAEHFLKNGKTLKYNSLLNYVVIDDKPEIDEYDKTTPIIVYTDGSCINNGYPNAKAGIGIYFGENDKRNVSRRVVGKQSNNTAEITAIIEVYNILKYEINSGKYVIIYTDSEYSIKCCTTYGAKCHKLNWSKPMPNKELVKEAYNIFSKYPNVRFQHIMAHTNKTDIHSIGNENADKLANDAVGYKDINKINVEFNNEFNNEKSNNRIYLNVPFSQKDIAKSNGAQWDKNKKKWYITDKLKNNEQLKSFL